MIEQVLFENTFFAIEQVTKEKLLLEKIDNLYNQIKKTGDFSDFHDFATLKNYLEVLTRKLSELNESINFDPSPELEKKLRRSTEKLRKTKENFDKLSGAYNEMQKYAGDIEFPESFENLESLREARAPLEHVKRAFQELSFPQQENLTFQNLLTSKEEEFQNLANSFKEKLLGDKRNALAGAIDELPENDFNSKILETTDKFINSFFDLDTTEEPSEVTEEYQTLIETICTIPDGGLDEGSREKLIGALCGIFAAVALSVALLGGVALVAMAIAALPLVAIGAGFAGVIAAIVSAVTTLGIPTTLLTVTTAVSAGVGFASIGPCAFFNETAKHKKEQASLTKQYEEVQGKCRDIFGSLSSQQAPRV